jgi:hypothetical protein
VQIGPNDEVGLERGFVFRLRDAVVHRHVEDVYADVELLGLSCPAPPPA